MHRGWLLKSIWIDKTLLIVAALTGDFAPLYLFRLTDCKDYGTVQAGGLAAPQAP